VSTPLILPHMGLAVEEGRVVAWHRSEGDAVRKGDVVCEVETDKATVELEAPADGVLLRILVPAGETASAGSSLALIGAEGEAADAAPGVSDVAPVPPGSARAPVPTPTAAAPEEGVPPRVRATPAARRLARQAGIDLRSLAGSGPGGRIRLADVQGAVRAEIPASLTRQRAAIARRMTESWRTIPQFDASREVDLTRVREFLRAVGPSVERSRGVRPSLTDFLAQACVRALQRRRELNADGREEVHLGLAVALDEGLLVPVIRDAHRLNLVELATARTAVVERARRGRLLPEDLGGGTFTLSNLGPFGVDRFTAIINPPERAILAVGEARERPVAVDGRVEVRWTAVLTLTVDHRWADGVHAARFLADVGEALAGEEGWPLF
jgi:pyruvate dehydrogenase E2 component (dihydrolipoamide acetyltransferase)